jgi:hypothetical protein
MLPHCIGFGSLRSDFPCYPSRRLQVFVYVRVYTGFCDFRKILNVFNTFQDFQRVKTPSAVVVFFFHAVSKPL